MRVNVAKYAPEKSCKYLPRNLEEDPRRMRDAISRRCGYFEKPARESNVIDYAPSTFLTKVIFLVAMMISHA
jgi:hypothetical protein